MHVGIGAHRARLAALPESVGFLGEFGNRNRESSVRHSNWGRRRHKAAARERPNRGRDDGSPSRAEERKNKDATTKDAHVGKRIQLKGNREAQEIHDHERSHEELAERNLHKISARRLHTQRGEGVRGLKGCMSGANG